MADRYGIFVTLKAKEGKIDELIAIAKGHFVRQHDGREPKATCASIVMPLPGEPNTVRFFEQWQDQDSYKLHSAPNENLQVFLDQAGPILDGAPTLIAAPMIHYEK